MKSLNYIDLFAGAGGLSEGFIRSGFNPIAHVEMNKDACETLKTRAAYHWLKENGKEQKYYNYLKSENKDKQLFWKEVPDDIINRVINKEISQETLSFIFNKIDEYSKEKKIDLIIGGPPCQAYSVAGRARRNMENDPRNYLYKYYVEFLKYYRPRMFVFENVPGILSASNGQHLKDILDAVREIGYEVSLPPNENHFLNAKDFGVLQDRKRVSIIGWKKELGLWYPEFLREEEDNYQVLRDLFSDLKYLNNGQGTLNAVKYVKEPTEYLRRAKIRNGLDFVTQHIARPNNENDLEIYRIAVEEWEKGKR